MDEVKLKTHLIITDIHSEFDINWCGKIRGTNPEVKNNMPVFVVIGALGRIELNTLDMKQLEEYAKRLTVPKGRSAVTKDSSHIYLKEIDGKETLMCVVSHKKVKSYAPMYDWVGWK